MKADWNGFGGPPTIRDDRHGNGFPVLFRAQLSDVGGERRKGRKKRKARRSAGPSGCGTGDSGTAAFARFAVPCFQPRITRRLRMRRVVTLLPAPGQVLRPSVSSVCSVVPGVWIWLRPSCRAGISASSVVPDFLPLVTTRGCGGTIRRIRRIRLIRFSLARIAASSAQTRQFARAPFSAEFSAVGVA